MTEIMLGPDDSFQLVIPLVVGHQTITIPVTLKGLAVLRRVLRDQREKSRPQLGQEAVPIQYMIERWLAEGGDITTPAKVTAEKIDPRLRKIQIQL